LFHDAGEKERASPFLKSNYGKRCSFFYSRLQCQPGSQNDRFKKSVWYRRLRKISGYLLNGLRQQQGYRYDIAQRFSLPSLSNVLECSLAECKKFIDDLVIEFDLFKKKRSVYFGPNHYAGAWSFGMKRKENIVKEVGRAPRLRMQKKRHKRKKRIRAQANRRNGSSGENDRHFSATVEYSKEQNSKENNSESKVITHSLTF
jgi:hypothetical protein